MRKWFQSGEKKRPLSDVSGREWCRISPKSLNLAKKNPQSVLAL